MNIPSNLPSIPTVPDDSDIPIDPDKVREVAEKLMLQSMLEDTAIDIFDPIEWILEDD